MANFANNTSTGSFTLAGNRTFTTVGAFTNAGAMIINKGSTFTVTAARATITSQSSGSTTVDGTLTVNAASMVDITGGNLFGATGNINGNVDLTGGVVNPGDGANLIGELKITGTYTQGSAGAATIDLGGKTAITQYSVLDITKAASLSGTLNVNLVNGFVPTVGNTFTILDYLSDTGMSMFTTTNLPTVSGDHWTITYDAKDVVLTLVAGPGPARHRGQSHQRSHVKHRRADNGQRFPGKASIAQRWRPRFHIEHSRTNRDSLACHMFRRSLVRIGLMRRPFCRDHRFGPRRGSQQRNAGIRGPRRRSQQRNASIFQVNTRQCSQQRNASVRRIHVGRSSQQRDGGHSLDLGDTRRRFERIIRLRFSDGQALRLRVLAFQHGAHYGLQQLNQTASPMR